MSFKIFVFIFTFFLSFPAYASGGYDNGTPAGKGHLDLELTWNPGDIIDNGQSYAVWGYGLTDRLDFHGYVSHEAGGTDQIYAGFMYNFLQNNRIDLATAVGVRHRRTINDLFWPQLLYTIKINKGYDVIGSVVNVYNQTLKTNRGMTYDVAFRIPLSILNTSTFLDNTKLAIGAFRSLSGKFHPTYSIDFRF
ncbi:MAG: hypothetical protein R8M14_08295 [Ghiorsea sp.]